MRHGKGEHVFENGVKYTGAWSEDKFHGKGVITKPDGVTKEYDGQWEHNVRKGWGIYYYEDGS